MTKPDRIEVFREAHELGKAHGWNARTYAAKLAEDCLAEGNLDEHMFWKAVAASLVPRNPARTDTPVAIWNGQAERPSSDHDSIYDEP